ATSAPESKPDGKLGPASYKRRFVAVSTITARPWPTSSTTAYAVPGAGLSVAGTSTGNSAHQARSRPGSGCAGSPSTTPASASAVTSSGGRGSVTAAHGT